MHDWYPPIGTIQYTSPPFLKSEVDDNAAIALTERLSGDVAFQKVRYITRDQALDEYRRSSGYAEAIDALDENPLPALLLIQPQLDSMIDGHDDQLIKMLQALPEIETAQYDQQWVKRLNAIIIIVQPPGYRTCGISCACRAVDHW